MDPLDRMFHVLVRTLRERNPALLTAPFTVGELDRITDHVRTAAYRVIEGKGATNYAIGLAGARIVEAILRDERAILPVSTVHEGYHGLHGVALSMPSVVDASGVSSVLDLELSPHDLVRVTGATVAPIRR